MSDTLDDLMDYLEIHIVLKEKEHKELRRHKLEWRR